MWLARLVFVLLPVPLPKIPSQPPHPPFVGFRFVSTSYPTPETVAVVAFHLEEFEPVAVKLLLEEMLNVGLPVWPTALLTVDSPA